MAEPPAGRASRLATTVIVLDLVGVFVFAFEGAMIAMANDLDALGIMVLASVTALGGGLVRDMLIGAIPPQVIGDWRYFACALGAAVLVFLLHGPLSVIPSRWLATIDAAGLAVFAIAGATKALAYGVNPLAAIMLGTVTGAGGGVIRDILLAQIPVVLHAEVYATAAALGSAVMVFGVRVKAPVAAAAVLGGLACFLLRVIAVWQQWNLPHSFGS